MKTTASSPSFAMTPTHLCSSCSTSFRFLFRNSYIVCFSFSNFSTRLFSKSRHVLLVSQSGKRHEARGHPNESDWLRQVATSKECLLLLNGRTLNAWLTYRREFMVTLSASACEAIRVANEERVSAYCSRAVLLIKCAHTTLAP